MDYTWSARIYSTLSYLVIILRASLPTLKHCTLVCIVLKYSNTQTLEVGTGFSYKKNTKKYQFLK